MVQLDSKPPYTVDYQEGIITDSTMILLRRMFSNTDEYRYYLNTLIVLRELIELNVCPDGVNPDPQHKQYPILKLTNELIGVLEGGRDMQKAPIRGLFLPGDR